MKKFVNNSFVQALIAFGLAFLVGLLVVSLFKEQIFELFLQFAPQNT